MASIDDIQGQVGSWHRKHFKDDQRESIGSRIVGKAYEELSELDIAQAAWHRSRREGLDNVADEAADVVLCMLALADREGFDLWPAVLKKFAVNVARSPERVKR